MRGVLRKINFVRNLFNRRQSDPDEIAEEKWIADFSSKKQVRFALKSESSHDVSLRKNLFYSGHSLALALKKTGCIAWTEAGERRFRDMSVSGSIRVDSRGGYAAGGVFFRMVDDKTYYSFLVSSKGYFRLDVLRNGMPFPLVGWTELPLFSGLLSADRALDFSLIAYGSHIVILVGGRWAAEINDPSISEGTLCFAAASYEPGDPAYKVIRDDKNPDGVSYTAEIFLESFQVESRITEVASLYEKWKASPDIDAKARLNLAETFAAMDQRNAALVQLRKAWDTDGHKKTQRELLLAGRLSRSLGLEADAESYISRCFQMDVETPEGKEAVTEMAGILYTGERYAELKNYCLEAVKIRNDDPALRTFLGHAYWNLNDYKNAAASYDLAFNLDRTNGIPAKNSGNVFEVMGRKKDALARYLDAGRAFLQAGNYNDLGLLVSKFLALGEGSREARSLAGKWAFAVEDWNMAEEEFKKSEELRRAARPKPRKDGAQVFLEALLLLRKGQRREALPLLEEAAALEKNYALFRFRLAENLFLLENNPDDPRVLDELNAALSLLGKNSGEGKIPAGKEDEGLAGWINNFAAQLALQRGNLDAAEVHLEKAAAVLGDLPAVKVNRGVLFYLRGSPDKAMELLDAGREKDPGGTMANCAGNLLVRSGRFEEADERYRKALAAAPDNVEYLRNRASCLMELGLYGEADTLLARAHSIAPSPDILEMISFVAAKKGEYPRAEQACRLALEIDPSHAPSLLSLGWILLARGRQEEAGGILSRLEKLELGGDAARGREEFRARLDELSWQTIACASCGRTWKLPKDPPPVPALRLFAMPPDDLPAGSCPGCGKTWCIGCAKNHLDPSGRFICPGCGRPLKLINEGLKKLIRDWAAAEGYLKADKSAAAERAPAPEKKRGRGRPPKKQNPPDTAGNPGAKPQTKAAAESPAPPPKRGRGRPRKTQ